jgi:hypothetical protein
MLSIASVLSSAASLPNPIEGKPLANSVPAITTEATAPAATPRIAPSRKVANPASSKPPPFLAPSTAALAVSQNVVVIYLFSFVDTNYYITCFYKIQFVLVLNR